MPEQEANKAKVFTVSFGKDYFETVVEHILQTVEKDLLTLSKCVIFVPSPRMQSALKDTFASALGGSVLLPKIRTLSVYEDDLETLRFDETLPENILPPLARLSVLSQLVFAKSPEKSQRQCLEEAWQLGTVFDRFSAYDVSLDQVESLLPETMAHAWQENVSFLKIALQGYPAWLQAADMIDASAYKKEDMLKVFYAQVNPSVPCFAVGFNDTTPAGLNVLKAVLAQEKGQLIFAPLSVKPLPEKLLPMDPFYRIKTVLDTLGIKQSDLQFLGGNVDEKPFMTSKKLSPEDCASLSLIEAKTAQKEADAIAMVMRSALELDEKCALVTSDRTLAQRVKSSLNRWNIEVDDSAGEALAQTHLGRCVLTGLQMVLKNFDVIDTLAFLTHPLVKPLENMALFDKHILQGSSVKEGLFGYERRIRQSRILPEEKQHLHVCVDRLKQSFPKGTRDTIKSFEEYIEILLDFMVEWIDVERVDAAENDALMQLLQEIKDQSDHFKKGDFSLFAAVLEQMMKRTTLRQRDKRQQNLAILGPMEARLYPLDTVIIGGLNEGSWPRKTKSDPWLNRSMIQSLNLLDTDAFIGLSAYDFLHLSHHKKVFWTRTLEEEGGETIPSRFLLRVQTQVDETLWTELKNKGDLWSNWFESLQKDMSKKESKRPAVFVPVSDRPCKWTPSLLSDYMTCPYKVFLKKIAAVPEKAVYAEAPTAADKGQLFHTCLEAMCAQVQGFPEPYSGSWKDKEAVVAHMLKIGKHAFSLENIEDKKGLWWQKFERISKGFADEMAVLDRKPWQIESMLKMRLTEKIHLSARFDRVDKDTEGAVHVLDYKTGRLPLVKDIYSGKAPQLAVEAVLAQQEGYTLKGLEFWEVKGEKQTNVHRKCFNKDLETFTQKAEEGLQKIAKTLTDEAFLYKPVPGSAFPEEKKKQCISCPYHGMCRYSEWLGKDV